MSNQPIRKTQARVVERERARTRRQAEQRDLLSRGLPFVIGAAVVLFVVVAIFIATNQTPSNTGGARVQVDREQIDFGNRVFDQPVRATFTVTNVGAGALKLDVPRVVTALEGCWPSPIVVGPTTLQPGQSTIISTEFTMHEGMGGKHLFEIPIQTNDATQPLKKLLIASNWVPR